MLVVASLVASGAGVSAQQGKIAGAVLSDWAQRQIESAVVLGARFEEATRELQRVLSEPVDVSGIRRALLALGEFPYRWAWGQKPGWDRGAPPRVFDRDRKGELCRVLARGRLNSCLLEFVDGYRVVTSRNGLRRA